MANRRLLLCVSLNARHWAFLSLAVTAGMILVFLSISKTRVQLAEGNERAAWKDEAIRIRREVLIPQLTNKTHIERAGCIRHRALVSHCRGTQYLLLESGGHDLWLDALETLKSEIGGIERPIAAGHDIRRLIPWWTPDSEGNGLVYSISRDTNSVLYIASVYLVRKTTGSLMYTDVLVLR